MLWAKQVKRPDYFIRAFFGIACATLFLWHMPVNYLTISDGDEILQATPLSFGGSLVTTYIHSVQLTPVVDEYKVSGGKIWSWEERVQSHNAGLPFAAPEHGRFIVDSPWMIVQGGRHAMARIALRVGTEEFGRNTWRLAPFPETMAYVKFASRRVTLAAEVRPLHEAAVIGLNGSGTSSKAQEP